MLVTFLVYREVPFSETVDIFRGTFVTVSSVLFIIAAASAFGYMLSSLEVPEMLGNALLVVSENPVVLLLLINGLLLVLGLIVDMAPLIVVMTPILLPIATDIGMSPVPFGIVLLFNLCIGVLTPPVANLLFAGIAAGNISIERGSRALVPFYAVPIAVLLLVTFAPALAMTLPRLLGA